MGENKGKKSFEARLRFYQVVLINISIVIVLLMYFFGGLFLIKLETYGDVDFTTHLLIASLVIVLFAMVLTFGIIIIINKTLKSSAENKSEKESVN
ncbi:MAG: hypothetical protein ACOX4W_02185 [Bacilli bacterium]